MIKLKSAYHATCDICEKEQIVEACNLAEATNELRALGWMTSGRRRMCFCSKECHVINAERKRLARYEPGGEMA